MPSAKRSAFQALFHLTSHKPSGPCRALPSLQKTKQEDALGICSVTELCPGSADPSSPNLTVLAPDTPTVLTPQLRNPVLALRPRILTSAKDMMLTWRHSG